MDDEGRRADEPKGGAAESPEGDQEEAAELSAAELARDRRRDHDAGARERAGMNTGLAKQFKQVLDTQRRRAEPDEARSRPGRKH